MSAARLLVWWLVSIIICLLGRFISVCRVLSAALCVKYWQMGVQSLIQHLTNEKCWKSWMYVGMFPLSWLLKGEITDVKFEGDFGRLWVQESSSTFWEILLFAFLSRVRWEDWCHSYICPWTIRLEPSAHQLFPVFTLSYKLTATGCSLIFNRQIWEWHRPSHLTLDKTANKRISQNVKLSLQRWVQLC